MHKLQIKTLSPTGELLHSINCLSGGITVLRGYSPSDLAPYQRLFSGSGGPDRFTLTLDGKSFDTRDAVRIGFAEDISQERIPLSDFLISSGVSKSALLSAAQAFGLEAALKNNCNQLSADHVRRAEILAATYIPKSTILVFNNPFEPIVSTWRERVAEQLIRFAQSSQSIMLVVSLDYRPESWVNNTRVHRIQMGQDDQKTIGFASQAPGNDAIAAALRDIRKEYGASQDQTKITDPKITDPKTTAPKTTGIDAASSSDTTVPPSSAPPSPARPQSVKKNSIPVSERPTSFLSSRNAFLGRLRKTPRLRLDILRGHSPKAMALVLLLVLGLSIASAVYRKLTPSDATLHVAASDPSSPTGGSLLPTDASAPESFVQDPMTNEIMADTSGNPDHIPTPRLNLVANTGSSRSDLLIDRYPQLIRSAIVQGFENTFAPRPRFAETGGLAGSGPSAQQTSETDGMDLFRALEKLSSEDSSGGSASSSYSSHIPAPDSGVSPSSDASLETLEERRQRIREKFLEAIERRSAGSPASDLE